MGINIAANNFGISYDLLYYTPQDLTEKFAAEIAGYSDVWAWIKARIAAQDWSGLMIGDYIPFTMNSNIVKAQIAGIDCYNNTYGSINGHHIDFISMDCYPDVVKWNTTDVNQGTAAEGSPWKVSNLYSTLNNSWYNYLPAALKNVIVQKRFLAETRYSSSGALSSSNSWEWKEIGKLWVPSEFEVFGSCLWSTPTYAAGQAMQYPIFANTWKYRVKGAGNGGSRCDWWLLTASGFSSSAACYVNYSGFANYLAASGGIYSFCVPVCFRIS